MHRANIKLTPTLVIGCGGRGSAAAAWCRRLMLHEVFRNEKELNENKSIRFLFFDSAPQRIEETNEILVEQTIPFNCGERIHEIINNPSYPAGGASVRGVGSLFPQGPDYRKVQDRIVDAIEGNNTCPPIGRMNLLGSWERVYNDLNKIIRQAWGGLGSVDEAPQVFILAGLFGGTGAGVHLDVAAMVRAICKELELSRKPDIYGVFFLPDLAGNVDQLRANAYACLREIDHFMMSGNAYVLGMANGEELRVNQSGGDFLFNNVFLVNDRNQIKGAPGVKLTQPEAARMAGEVLFHWVATEVGASIRQRLVDRPLLLSKEEVPQGAAERRIRAYSTFGCATVTIPYAEIGHNLAVHLAREVMNDLLCRPDHQTLQERAEVQRQKEAFHRAFPIGKVCEVLGLTEKDLNRSLKIKLPPILSNVSALEVPPFAEFCDDRGFDNDVPRALAEINMQIQGLLNQGASDTADEQGKLLDEFQQKLATNAARMVNDGGPTLAALTIDRLLDHIDSMIKKYRAFANADDADVSKALNRMREIRGALSGVSTVMRPFSRAWKEGMEELDEGLFARLIQKATGYCKGLQKEKFISVLLEFRRFVETEKGKIGKQSTRYDEILNKLKEKVFPYTVDKLHLSTIPGHCIEEFIDAFPFPQEVRHDALADILRKDGLLIQDPTGERTVRVNEFHLYPDQVAEALFRLGQKVVSDHGDLLLSRCWSESGFYPLTHVDSNDWNLYCYQKTYKEVKEHAGPYLEYNDNYGFTTHKLAFIINPRTEIPGERAKWQDLAPTDVHQYNSFTGAGKPSPYSLTLLRFDCALPLYSIDGIAEWRKDYESILHRTDRPLHKFKEFESFREPYAIFSEPKPLTTDEIQALYDWAAEISRTALYPIFTPIPNAWLLRSAEPVVRNFYFVTKADKYLGLERVLGLLEESPKLKEEAVRMLLNLINHKGSEGSLADIEPLRAFQMALDQQAKIESVLNSLCGRGVDLETPMLKIKNGKIHFAPDQFVEARSLVEDNFRERVDAPILRENITHDQVRQQLHSNPAFRKIFLDLVDEALRFMNLRGDHYPSLPVDLF